MELNHVWRGRLGRAGRIAAGTAAAVVVGGTAVSGLDTVWHWISPPQPPPITEMARDVVNETDAVEAFAEDCVANLLTATAATGKGITRCVPTGRGYAFTAKTTTVASDARARRIRIQWSENGTTLYAVLVQVSARPYPSAPQATEYYSLPVAVTDGGGMQAVDKISRVDPPPPGADAPLAYGTRVAPESKLHAVLAGFAAAFLAGTGDLERFVTTDSGLTTLAAYAKDKTALTAAETQGDPPDNPADGIELAAHIDVSATRADHSKTDQLSYPLTLRSVGGSWFVARIDAAPVTTTKTHAGGTP